MSRWEPRRFPEARPKQPAPQHGIKIQKVGTTWWGKLWISALERMSEGYSNRLARGRSYARAGRTHDLKIDHGSVIAKVTGSRPKPYVVTLKLTSLSDATWKHAIEAMAAKAHFSAQLLSGHMPARIEEAFEGSGASLFPTHEADLITECTCPDFANPCKHVAATHYVLGESLDRDPFLLFELRGREKEQVLAALRLARTGETEAVENDRADASDREITIPSVSLENLEVSDYEKPREELASLNLSFEKPTSEAAILRQLGAPNSWREQTSPAELLSPLVRAAAVRARRIALGDIESKGAEESAGSSPAPSNRKERIAKAEAESRKFSSSERSSATAEQARSERQKSKSPGSTSTPTRRR